jgi:uncharacterized linocin/CFP29 family protein
MNDINWDQSVWQDINDAVVKEISKARIAQQVFPTTRFDNNPTEVANEVIDFSDLSIREGLTKAFVEIHLEFPLTSTQVAKEPEKKTCKTLARMAAKALALAEDTVIFQGQGSTAPTSPPPPGGLPAGVTVDHIESSGAGLLGEATPPDANDNDPRKVSEPIDVGRPPNARQGVLFGENIFAAVANGIAKLTAKTQAPKYGLFLPITVYADTYVPPSAASLVTTAERIRPLVEGGFFGTGTLPANEGLLVALAGDPTVLYVGREATTEFVRKEGSKYFFRVVERIQFVARDPRALVLLRFQF